MKHAFLASIVTAIVLATAAYLALRDLLDGESRSSDAASSATAMSESATARRLAATDAEVGALTERMSRLEDTLARALDRIESALDARSSRDTATSDASRAASSGTPLVDATAPALDADSESAVALAATLAESDDVDEAAGRLRDVVFHLIEEERELQRQKAQEAADRQRKEWQEMNEGPWGNYNFKVNSLAKQLDLDDEQKRYYHDVLVRHADLITQAKSGVDWQDAEARSTFQTRQQELVRSFHEAVVAGLSVEQAKSYEEIPEWQRQPDQRAKQTSFGAGPPGVVTWGGAGAGGGAPRATAITVRTAQE